MELSEIDIVRLPLKAAWARQVLIARGIMRLDAAELMRYAFQVPDNAQTLVVSVMEMDEGVTAVYACDGNGWESSVEIPAGTWSAVFNVICMAIDTILDEYAALDYEEEDTYIDNERF